MEGHVVIAKVDLEGSLLAKIYCIATKEERKCTPAPF
jgi:hypothetical protein